MGVPNGGGPAPERDRVPNLKRATERTRISRRRFIAGGATGGAAVATGLLLPSFAAEALAEEGSADPRLALQLLGEDEVEERDIPPIYNEAGDTVLADRGLCFDVDLLNLRTGKVIGTATDCLALVEEQGDGLVLVGTTTFNMPGGSFTSRGVTTVEPVATHPQFPSLSSAATHTTGSIPDESPGNNVIAGSGRFAGLEASVRLSGAVNMSQFGAGIIGFDCIFVVTPL
jgi:hypothetical protein